MNFPMAWDVRHFSGSTGFASPKRQMFLGINFGKGGLYNFEVREEVYVLSELSSHYEMMRKKVEFSIDPEKVSLRCWTDSMLRDHLSFEVKNKDQLLDGSSSSLELIR